MRRSSRVILLLGILLAVGAFVLVVLSAGGGPGPSPSPATVKIVVAAVDIPQGTTITSSMINTRTVDLALAPPDSIALPEQVLGKTARESVPKDAYVPQSAITGVTGRAALDIAKELEAGERAMAIEVDELSGVGTLIQPGDRVDMIVGISKGNLPVVIELQLRPGADTPSDVPIGVPAAPGQPGFQVIGGDKINATSVKLLVQNVRVVSVLLSQPQQGAAATAAPEQPQVSGRTALVIVAVSAQQTEVLRYAQMEGTITMVLRAPDDATASPDTTTGIVLRTLIDQYGVLPPRLVVTQR